LDDQSALHANHRLSRRGKPQHVCRTAGQRRDADELLAILASKSRDNSRTPMQWTGENGGFTTGEPWIGLCDNRDD
jgi:glycosidase